MPARRAVFRLMFAFVALFAGTAHALFDPPWITPANPVASELVSVNIRAGVCDAIFGENGYPQISQVGNAIRMRWYGQHWPEGSGDLLCSFPIGTFTPPVGTYPAGDYMLTIELAYDDYFEGPSVMTIGAVSFRVARASAPAPVPTLNTFGVSALLIIVLALSRRMLRTRLAVNPIGTSTCRQKHTN